jgi:hypothetical protein
MKYSGANDKDQNDRENDPKPAHVVNSVSAPQSPFGLARRGLAYYFPYRSS